MKKFIKCTNDFCIAKEICNRHILNNIEESNNKISILTQCFPYNEREGCDFFIPTKNTTKVDIESMKMTHDRKGNGGC